MRMQLLPLLAPQAVLALLLLAAAPAASSAGGSAASVAAPRARRTCETGGEHAHLPFCNSSLALEERVDDLLQRSTMEELIAQLLLGPDDSPGIARLGVPPLGTAEALHGVCTALDSRKLGCLPPPWAAEGSGCATAFPAPIALGATFDTSLYFEIGAAIAAEARAFNNYKFQHPASEFLFRHHNPQALVFYAPNVNLVKDPRWGPSFATPPLPVCAFTSHAQGSNVVVATMPCVWLGRAKSPTTRAGRALDSALRLE